LYTLENPRKIQNLKSDISGPRQNLKNPADLVGLASKPKAKEEIGFKI
jgi:hypothetical protein